MLGLSLDASGSVGGVDFDDEDVLRFDPGGPSWTLAYDGSAEDASLAPVDTVALPEPGQLWMLASGLGLLIGLGRQRIVR